MQYQPEKHKAIGFGRVLAAGFSELLWVEALLMILTWEKVWVQESLSPVSAHSG